MREIKFLPDVKVTTIVWGEKGDEVKLPWEVAQGDDLGNRRATIELNFPKIAQRCGDDLERIAESMAEGWLSIWVVLATRQDLINKGIRGAVSPEAERTLYKANFKAIMESPILKRYYADIATGEILNGEWVIDESYKQLSDAVLMILRGKK